MNANEIIDGLPVIFWFVIDDKGNKFDPFLSSVRSPVWLLSTGENKTVEVCKINGLAGAVPIAFLEVVTAETLAYAESKGLKRLSADGSDFGGRPKPTFEISLQTAVNTLRTALSNDTELYYAYQANIAVAMVEEWRKFVGIGILRNDAKTEMGESQIDDIANAGVNQQGAIVDRRVDSNAVPIPAGNGAPEPKPVP